MDFNKFKRLVSQKVHHAGRGMGEFRASSIFYEWVLRGESGTLFHISYRPSNRKARRWYCHIAGSSRNNALSGPSLDYVLQVTLCHVVDVEFPELRK